MKKLILFVVIALVGCANLEKKDSSNEVSLKGNKDTGLYGTVPGGSFTLNGFITSSGSYGLH